MTHAVAGTGRVRLHSRSGRGSRKVHRAGGQLAPHSGPACVTQTRRAVDARAVVRTIERARPCRIRQPEVAHAAEPARITVTGIVRRAHPSRAAVPRAQPVLQDHQRAVVPRPRVIARAGAVGAGSVVGTVIGAE
jgi:hypothetical protein